MTMPNNHGWSAFGVDPQAYFAGGRQVRLLALFMGFLLCLQLTCCPIVDAAAASSALSVTSGGGVQGKIPCNKIGALLLADGAAIMNGTTIEVTGKGQTQLKGKIFKSESINGNVNGSVYFDEGPGLSTLLGANCKEYVKLTDGTTQNGPIDSITSDAVTCGGRSIPMGQVLKIHSAKVFNFHAKDHISFEATCVHAAGAGKNSTKTSKSTSTGDHFWQRHPFWTVAIMAGIGCGIATAIAVPIACSNRGHHNNQQQTLNNIALVKALQAHQSAPVVSQPVSTPVVTRPAQLSSSSFQSSSGQIVVNSQGFPTLNGVLLPSSP